MAGRTRQPRSVLERGLMTPEQAQEALEKWESGVFDYRTVKQALRTIASMHYEYAVQGRFTKKLEWGSFQDAEKELAEVRGAWWSSGSYRIVRRLVSDPEVVE